MLQSGVDMKEKKMNQELTFFRHHNAHMNHPIYSNYLPNQEKNVKVLLYVQSLKMAGIRKFHPMHGHRKALWKLYMSHQRKKKMKNVVH